MNLQRIYTSRVVLYRVSTGCRSDITSVVLRRTRYSALVYVTEKRRIGHTVAPILEVEHRWYRHQRSAAETVTDIPAECTSSSTPGKFAKLFGPSFQIKEYTLYLSFFFRFNIDINVLRRIACRSRVRTISPNTNRLWKHVFIFHLAPFARLSRKDPIARQSKRTRSYPNTVTTHNQPINSIQFNSDRRAILSLCKDKTSNFRISIFTFNHEN